VQHYKQAMMYRQTGHAHARDRIQKHADTTTASKTTRTSRILDAFVRNKNIVRYLEKLARLKKHLIPPAREQLSPQRQWQRHGVKELPPSGR